MDLLSAEYILSIIIQNIRLLSVIFILMFLYKYYTRTFDFFSVRGVPFLKPQIILGSWAARVFQKESFHNFNIQIYNKFSKSPYGGYFEGSQPLFLMRDPDLLKAIMVKDSDYFTDRNFLNSRAPPYFAKMLINLKGDEWKNLRTKLTHTFTASKLRGMENLIKDCSKQMVDYLNIKLKEQGKEVELHNFFARYSLEVIGCCAFGFNCSSFKDPNAKFVKIAAQLLRIPIYEKLILLLTSFLFPTLIKYLPISIFNTKAGDYLKGVILKTKNERERLSEKRKDFLQLLLDVAEKEHNENSKEKIMTDDVIVGQSILFLFAGFETSTTALSFVCGELALNPDIQEHLRKEIKEAAARSEGECTYNLINEMQYLDQVILESLRKYPPVSRIDRVCTKSYTLPGVKWSLRPGDIIAIPIAGIMYDPTYYPEPEVFDPDRFSAEEKQARPQELYLSWGLGPRNCIGARFGVMTIKFALFYLLKDFKITKCSKTEDFRIYDKTHFLLKSVNGTHVNIEPIDSKTDNTV